MWVLAIPSSFRMGLTVPERPAMEFKVGPLSYRVSVGLEADINHQATTNQSYLPDRAPVKTLGTKTYPVSFSGW